MNIEQERAEFEVWAKADGYEDFERFGEGYSHPELREAWRGYQAGRSALQSQDAEDAFIDGVLLGLQVITGAGNAGSADHDELMRSAGVDLVVRRAIEQEMWELAGLDRNQISITARRRIEGET